jgi:GNAT superfamily N-acetyltransferase
MRDKGADAQMAHSARNGAAWHRASLDALGLESSETNGLWSCHEPGPPIYLSAINLSPGDVESKLARIEALVAQPGREVVAVWDSYQEWDLKSRGFQVYEEGYWYVREPGGEPPPSPSGLHIETVATPEGLIEFERMSSAGFESPPPQPAAVHHPDSLGDGPLTYFLGRVDGEPVTASITCVAEGCVGVYGLATIPEFRNRGYGAAMTWRAISVAPELPSVLQPSDLARPLYRRLGYEPVGRFTNWMHRK